MTMSGNDFRLYAGVDFSSEFLAHYGVGHDQSGHSGRYPWGSGDRPKQRYLSSTSAKSDATYRRDSKRVKKILAKADKERDYYGDGVSYKVTRKDYDELTKAVGNHADPRLVKKFMALIRYNDEVQDALYKEEQEWINNSPKLDKLSREWTGDGTEFYWKAQELVPNKDLDAKTERHYFFYTMADNMPKAVGQDLNSIISLKDNEYLKIKDGGKASRSTVKRDALYDAGKSLKDEEIAEYKDWMIKEIDKHYKKCQELGWAPDYYCRVYAKELEKDMRK